MWVIGWLVRLAAGNHQVRASISPCPPERPNNVVSRYRRVEGFPSGLDRREGRIRMTVLKWGRMLVGRGTSHPSRRKP